MRSIFDIITINMMPTEGRNIIIDRLKRALEMEEKMAICLVDLCNKPSNMTDIPEDIRIKLVKTLNRIKNDTMRHKNTVDDVLNQMGIN